MAEDQGSASRSRSASGNDAREDVVAAAFTECIYSGQIRDNSGSSSPVNPPLDRASTMLPPHPSAASIDGMNDYFHQALQLTAPSAQQTHAVETRDWRCVNNLLNHHDRACWECPSSSYPPLPSSSVSDVPAEKIDDQRKEMTPAEHPPGQQETQTQVTSSLSKRRKSLQNRIKKFSLHRQGRKSSPSSAPGTKKTSSSSGTKSRSWGGVFRLNCSFGGSWSPTIDERSRSSSPSPQEPSSGGAVPNPTNPACVCTGYRRLEDEVNQPFSPVIDLSRFNPEEFPIEDFDERARMERAREIDEGVDPPPGFVVPFSFSDSMSPGIDGALTLVTASSTSNGNAVANFPFCCARSSPPLSSSTSSLVAATGFSTETRFESFFSTLDGDCTLRRTVHTQVDYVHCLVPDLLSIANFPFYWGKMDRYEAERLLENKAEGTFLLRDSAQEDYFFSVSFRRYGRSLHARIEQWNHMFSFDSHDPSVFSAPAVSQLMDHYKDPSSCMFFEPLLTSPLNRNFAFPLQHLCRAVVCSNTTYDGINQLKLPKTLKAYLREYHYKQKLRVRRFQVEH